MKISDIYQDFSLIICSYAMRLLHSSMLPNLLYQLSRLSSTLLIISPHNRPKIKPEFEWKNIGEIREGKAKARLYQTTR